MSRSNRGDRASDTYQPAAATAGQLPARFKLGADTPSNPYNLIGQRPAASGMHTHSDERNVAE